MVAAVLVGIGGTAILDLVSFLMERFFGVPATNWRMVGRWLGHMPKGQFVQRDLKQAGPVPVEHALGWVFHYLVGAGYGLLLVAIWGAGWLESPRIVQPMILVLVLLVLPFFVMMPGMGMGIAASRTPKPNVARLKSVPGPLHLRLRHVPDRMADDNRRVTVVDRHRHWPELGGWR